MKRLSESTVDGTSSKDVYPANNPGIRPPTVLPYCTLRLQHNPDSPAPSAFRDLES